MAFQILLNLFLAFIWMFLQNSWTFITFFVGYLIGLGLLFLLRRFLPGQFYFRKGIAILALFFLFLRELILSSMAVIKQVIKPKLDIRPGIFAYPTELRSDWEITTLACLITLTPGTLALEVSPEGNILYIHAMDIEDSKEVVLQIKNTFEKAIMEVSR